MKLMDLMGIPMPGWGIKGRQGGLSDKARTLCDYPKACQHDHRLLVHSGRDGEGERLSVWVPVHSGVCA